MVSLGERIWTNFFFFFFQFFPVSLKTESRLLACWVPDRVYYPIYEFLQPNIGIGGVLGAPFLLKLTIPFLFQRLSASPSLTWHFYCSVPMQILSCKVCIVYVIVLRSSTCLIMDCTFHCKFNGFMPIIKGLFIWQRLCPTYLSAMKESNHVNIWAFSNFNFVIDLYWLRWWFPKCTNWYNVISWNL